MPGVKENLSRIKVQTIWAVFYPLLHREFPGDTFCITCAVCRFRLHLVPAGRQILSHHIPDQIGSRHVLTVNRLAVDSQGDAVRAFQPGFIISHPDCDLRTSRGEQASRTGRDR